MTDATATASAAPVRDDGVTSNPARELWVAQCADPGDPAFDTAHPQFAVCLARYIRTRSLDDLAKVPVLPGLRPALYLLRPLRTSERTDVLNQPGEALQRFVAVCTAVHKVLVGASIADGKVSGGTVVEATVSKGGALPMADAAWMDRLSEEAGGQIVDELGALVIQRANVHPTARGSYRLPYPVAETRPQRT